jgi:hypothetical protein
MSELELREARELLIGTWIGIAHLADTLIENGVLSRGELLRTLSQIGEAASDERRTALAGLQLLIGRGFRCPPSFAPAKAGGAPQRCGHLSSRPQSLFLRPAIARSHQLSTTGKLRAFVNLGVNKRHSQQ